MANECGYLLSARHVKLIILLIAPNGRRCSTCKSVSHMLASRAELMLRLVLFPQSRRHVREAWDRFRSLGRHDEKGGSYRGHGTTQVGWEMRGVVGFSTSRWSGTQPCCGITMLSYRPILVSSVGILVLAPKLTASAPFRNPAVEAQAIDRVVSARATDAYRV